MLTALFLHLLLELAREDFCWYFIPNHRENHVQNLTKTEMKSDFPWKRQTFHLNPVASSASALAIRARKSCEAAQIWSKYVLNIRIFLSVNIPQA